MYKSDTYCPPEEKTSSLLGRIIDQGRTAYYKLGAVAVLELGSLIGKDTDSIEAAFPNATDHIGNFGHSAGLSMAASLVVSRRSKEFSAMSYGRRAIIAAGVVATGAAVNYLAEFAYPGLHGQVMDVVSQTDAFSALPEQLQANLMTPPTPDAQDVAYGIAGATTGASIALFPQVKNT
jgi:hypothetical protein